MIQRVFANMMEISLTASAVIILVCALLPILEKRYMAKWKYYVWLGIALRLLIPIPLTMPDAPIQIDTSQVFQESGSWNAPFPSGIVMQDEIHSPGEKQTKPSSNISLLQTGTILWALGAGAFFIYHVLQYLFYLRGIRRWSLSPGSEQSMIFSKIKNDLGIIRNISLWRCKTINSPMMLGIMHPTVLIPCVEYTETDLYLILKHELMHYKQHDIEAKALMFLVQTLYWFNAFVHLMAKKFNEAIEMNCDEYVISGDDVVYKNRYIETIMQSIKQQNTAMNVFTTNYNGGIEMVKKRFKNIIHSGSKKRGLAVLTAFMIVCLALSSLVACSPKGSIANAEPSGQNAPNEKVAADNTDEQKNTEAETPENLSDKIIGVYAESKPNAKLEKTIIDYLEIPEEYLSKTMYYYNYVDLNGDGADEILTVVMGPYTSGTGGSTALHIVQTPDMEMHVNQKFTLIQTPVIISDKVTKGCKEIIVMRSGGGAEANYVVLTASDGQYKDVNDGTVIKDLKGVSGTAIMSNDILKDMEEGKALYLKKD